MLRLKARELLYMKLAMSILSHDAAGTETDASAPPGNCRDGGSNITWVLLVCGYFDILWPTQIETGWNMIYCECLKVTRHSFIGTAFCDLFYDCISEEG